MAVYEYDCTTCDRPFEQQRSMTSDDGAVTCPACGSDHVRRRFSLFAAGRSAPGAGTVPAGGGGGCACGGACACGH